MKACVVGVSVCMAFLRWILQMHAALPQSRTHPHPPMGVLIPWARLGWRLEQGDQEFEVIISYAAGFRLSYMKSCLKNNTS